MFFVVYVLGSAEDPALGAHGAFLKKLTSVAAEIKDYRGLPSAGELLVWSRLTPSHS